MLPIALAALLLAAPMTGYLVYREDSYTDEVGLLVDSDTGSFPWSPENPGELGYVRISGYIRGNGSARVYLRSGGEQRLILDSKNLDGGSPLTGMLTAIGVNGSGEDPDGTASGEPLQYGEAEETEPDGDASPDGSGANATEELSQAEKPDAGEALPEGGEANETVQPPETSTGTPTDSGNETGADQAQAGNLTEPNNLTEHANMTGFLGEEAAPNETNVTGHDEPANATVPESNATGQENEALPPGNLTGPSGEGNATDVSPEPETAAEVPDISFEGCCDETCSLAGFPQGGYSLAFDIEPGTTVRIDSIEYSVRVAQEPENLTALVNLTEPLEPVNITTPGNLTGLPEPNLTPPSNMTLDQALEAELLEISEMRAMGFGIHRCSSREGCNDGISSLRSGGIVMLDAPLECLGDCLILRDTGNIILDCRGNPIRGDGSGTGISLENSTYVIIKNCDVSGFERGISLDRDSSFNIITSTRASSNEMDLTIPSSTSNIINNIDARITVSGSGA